MTTFKRTTSDDIDFKYLTNLFDEFLVEIDGEEKDFFAQYNHIYIKNVMVCYENGKPVGCGAFKEYETNVAEIKRMFVDPMFRGRGIAAKLLNQLESWAIEEQYNSFILETSIKLENAISLYKKMGYQIVPNYGQYIGVQSSICMKKII